jgi:hypothetical protein
MSGVEGPQANPVDLRHVSVVESRNPTRSAFLGPTNNHAFDFRAPPFDMPLHFFAIGFPLWLVNSKEPRGPECTKSHRTNSPTARSSSPVGKGHKAAKASDGTGSPVGLYLREIRSLSLLSRRVWSRSPNASKLAVGRRWGDSSPKGRRSISATIAGLFCTLNRNATVWAWVVVVSLTAAKNSDDLRMVHRRRERHYRSVRGIVRRGVRRDGQQAPPRRQEKPPTDTRRKNDCTSEPWPEPAEAHRFVAP